MTCQSLGRTDQALLQLQALLNSQDYQGLEILNSNPTKAARGMRVGQAEASRSGLCLDGVESVAKVLGHLVLLPFH